ADFFAPFAELLFFLTVFFAISRPVAMQATLETPEPRVETGAGFCGNQRARQMGSPIAARLIFGHCPQSRLNCRIASLALSRRGALRPGRWRNERGQEKGNRARTSHARRTSGQEAGGNRQDLGSSSAPSAGGD